MTESGEAVLTTHAMKVSSRDTLKNEVVAWSSKYEKKSEEVENNIS
jgi:hypothetical protein